MNLMGRLYDIRLQPYSWIHGLSFSKGQQRYTENVLTLLGTFVISWFNTIQLTNVSLCKHSCEIEKFLININIQ